MEHDLAVNFHLQASKQSSKPITKTEIVLCKPDHKAQFTQLRFEKGNVPPPPQLKRMELP